jgi:WD40-like Beta Propeller Repeat
MGCIGSPGLAVPIQARRSRPSRAARATTGRGAQHPARFRRPLEDNRAMSSSSTKTAPYGSWRSPITSDLIVAQSITLSEVCLDGGHVYWLEGRPQEQGRYVVVRGNADGRPTDITPPPYNARTRVHEYGGGSWTVWNGTVYFSNFADGRLYRQVPGTSEPQALTPEPSARGRQWRFADGVIDQRRNRWIGVREDHTLDGEPVNAIVDVDLQGNAGPGRVLASGHDFYASPRLSPNGRWLTWLAWDHPNMPWNGTRLYLGEVTENGAISGPQPIAGGATESIFQPEWSPDSAQIMFVSDRSGPRHSSNEAGEQSEGSPLRRRLRGRSQRSRWSEGRGPRGIRTSTTRTGPRARLA